MTDSETLRNLRNQPIYQQKTQSICPECLRTIDALIYEEDGKIKMKKSCPDHGEYIDLLSRDAEYYKKNQFYYTDGMPVNLDKRTNCESHAGCPHDCGLCERHLTSPIMTIIDLTNKCNLRCPVCFANAAVSGFVVEPPFDDVVRMMKHLRELRPYPNVCVTWSGGEPTLRDDLPEIIEKANELGFNQTMLITNGIKFKNLAYAQKIKDTGLKTIYLQFDGTTPETWIQTRGVNLWPIKQQIIRNLRKVGFDSVVLVPTIVPGVNEHEIGNIIQFAADNIDIIRAISFQPVSYCGRIDRHKLEEERFNHDDLIRLVSEQTGGVLNKNVFYPIPVVAPLAHLVCWYTGQEGVDFGCSPDCGWATFMVINEETGKLECITDYIDVKKFFELTRKYWNEVKGKHFNHFKTLARSSPWQIPGLMRLGKLIDEAHLWLYKKEIMLRFFWDTLGTIKKVGKPIQSVSKILLRDKWDDVASFMYDTLMIGCMHFQDPYNMNVHRTERCIIHYVFVDPRDNKVKHAPFCTYNSIHRPKIEKLVAIPYEESKVDEGEVLKPEGPIPTPE
ncbi:MAG: radical SAM protein [Candidatus Helarchaeota archaeon]